MDCFAETMLHDSNFVNEMIFQRVDFTGTIMDSQPNLHVEQFRVGGYDYIICVESSWKWGKIVINYVAKAKKYRTKLHLRKKIDNFKVCFPFETGGRRSWRAGADCKSVGLCL